MVECEYMYYLYIIKFWYIVNFLNVLFFVRVSTGSFLSIAKTQYVFERNNILNLIVEGGSVWYRSVGTYWNPSGTSLMVFYHGGSRTVRTKM